MSARRRTAATLYFLAGLVALALGTALLAGIVLNVQQQAQTRTRAEGITGGRVTAGKLAISRYGCTGCHAIPGTDGAHGQVGPALSGVAVQAQIAGKLPNDPAAMARWLEHPQSINPGSGMPELGVTPGDARDMAAFLYTLQ